MAIKLFEPVFDIDACLAQLRECLEIGWTGMGFKTVELERAWKEYTGAPHALFLNSCTAALNLAVDVLKEQNNWEDGCEILTTPNTFVSTNHAILRSGLKPVFADIDATMCMDPREARKKITDRTRAVIYVGIGGNAGRYDEIVRLCADYGLKLILDAAHMAGTRLHGEHIGKEADAVCYSFQAVKNLPTGDSGMLCCRDAAADSMARKKAWLGINKDTYQRTLGEGGYRWQYQVEYVGDKYNGNAIMAAIALAQLPLLEQGNARRRQIAARYRQCFAPYSDKICMVEEIPDSESSCHLFQIIVEERDALMTYLGTQGISAGVHYVSNTRYSMYRCEENFCPNAEYISDHVISLPMHLNLTDAQVQLVADTVISFVNQ